MRLLLNFYLFFRKKMSVSTAYSDSWPCQKGLTICHLNINHIINKLNEISHILFSKNLEVFAFSESRLNGNIDNDEIQIPGYLADRRDLSYFHHTGLLPYLPYRCSLSDTTLDTMVLHSSLLVAISAHLFMFIPVYRETFPSHPHLFLPRLRLPFTMPSVIIRCRLSCLLTCP